VVALGRKRRVWKFLPAATHGGIDADRPYRSTIEPNRISGKSKIVSCRVGELPFGERGDKRTIRRPPLNGV
jgi:hypothetical protein